MVVRILIAFALIYAYIGALRGAWLLRRTLLIMISMRGGDNVVAARFRPSDGGRTGVDVETNAAKLVAAAVVINAVLWPIRIIDVAVVAVEPSES